MLPALHSDKYSQNVLKINVMILRLTGYDTSIKHPNQRKAINNMHSIWNNQKQEER